MVERRPEEPRVVGSSPAVSICFLASSSNGRTQDFDSCDAGSNPAEAAVSIA